MDYQTITVEQRGTVDWLTLNRPVALNALNQQMVDELGDYFRGLYRRPDRRIVVLKAALALEDRQQVLLGQTADHREAISAFTEKRYPVYRDK